ncbi:hypothetical protein GCM10010191_74860 [Actinomadura vinacea]|uniref:Histidine kinase/HSP90-like ATPase domain-containing protein n=1 Tax=Actinomadura vinacea TaxID=115336 RepID=A0ABN3K1I0_9ACTN
MSASSVVLLPYAPSSVAVARKRLRSELTASGVFESVLDDVSVIVSELLSNALRHARPLPSGQIRLAWAHDGETLELSVTDGGAMTEPRRGPGTLSSLGGRGLGIVEALSEGWGVRHENGSTIVWAVLHTPKIADSDLSRPSTGLPEFGAFEDITNGPPGGRHNGDARETAPTRAFPR